MQCYHPLPAWRSKHRSPGGAWPVTFDINEGFKDKPVQLPCGRCIGCRINKASTWTTRIMHEATLHTHTAFLTLTYDDQHLPSTGSLRPRDMVDFLKRLRYHIAPTHIRFFQVGEYGDQTARPHHHLLLFGHHFTDRVQHTQGKYPLHTSRDLDSIWSHGYCYIGDLTRESAQYCASYVTKRITGPAAEQHYGGRHPEYATMSRRPGIGANFAKKWRNDIYPEGTITLAGGTKLKTPPIYDRHLQVNDPEAYKQLVMRRRLAQVLQGPTPRRLINKEVIHKARLSLKRQRPL